MPVPLATLPYEPRCAEFVHEQEVALPSCCPVTHNPQAGSTLTLIYRPRQRVLEVRSLAEYVQSYKGGRGDVRDMEGMVAQIAQDCAEAAGVPVTFRALLYIDPAPAPNSLPMQQMRPRGTARPRAQSDRAVSADAAGATAPTLSRVDVNQPPAPAPTHA